MPFKDFVDTEHQIKYQVQENAKDVLTLQEQMASLQLVIQRLSVQAEEISELYANLKVFLRILSLLEKAAKWLITIGAGFGIVWAVWKYLIVETLRDVAGRIPR